MKPKRIQIQDFRMIENSEYNLSEFTALVGPNNAGKSTVLAAIQAFYSGKFLDDRDKRWSLSPDESGWPSIAIDFEVEDFEIPEYARQYAKDSLLTITRIFYQTWGVKKGRLHLSREGSYPYVEADKNLSPFIGRCILVPTITKIEDQTKTSGPSPLREILRIALDEPKVAEALASTENALVQLRQAIEREGGPAWRLQDQVNRRLLPWGITTKVRIDPFTTDMEFYRELDQLDLAEILTEEEQPNDCAEGSRVRPKRTAVVRM